MRRKRTILFRKGKLTRTGKAQLAKHGMTDGASADLEAEVIRSTVVKLESLATDAQTRVISYLGARYSKVQEDQ